MLGGAQYIATLYYDFITNIRKKGTDTPSPSLHSELRQPSSAVVVGGVTYDAICLSTCCHQSAALD